MQTDHLLPRPETPSLKRLLWVPVVVLAILVGASVFWYKSMPTGGASFDPIFHQTKDGWRQMPMPAGSLGDNIRVSGRGTVWLDTWAGVSRWDGAAWRLYNETISHDGAGPTHGGFALDGEEVWTLKKKGVLHWDGQLWKFYREPYTADGASMVAGDGQAWILDLKGNFSHFQDGRWESHALELPGVSWTGKDAGWPALARTADGVVWLVCRGIWRLDGARWSRMTEGADGLGHAVLVGAVADRLWFSDSKGLRSVSKDGGDWIVSPAQRTGLAARVWFYDVASAAGRTWFATSSGLVEFDGTVWRPVALPGVEVPGISRVTAGPDGDLWIIGSPPAWRAWRTLLGLALLPLAILVVIFWISRRLAHRRLQQHRRVTEAVQHATGEIPQELEHGERRLVRSLSWREYIIITAVLYIGGFTVLQRLWPKGTLWPIPVILVGIHLAEIFRDSLMKRKLIGPDRAGRSVAL